MRAAEDVIVGPPIAVELFPLALSGINKVKYPAHQRLLGVFVRPRGLSLLNASPFAGRCYSSRRFVARRINRGESARSFAGKQNSPNWVRDKHSHYDQYRGRSRQPCGGLGDPR